MQNKSGSSWADEAALVAAVRDGNRKAEATFVRRFSGRMQAVATHMMGDAALAEDCVQEAFLAAFRNLARFEGRSGIGTWLYRITVNVCLMKLRSRNRAPETLLGDPLPVHAAAGYFAEALWAVPKCAEDRIAEQQLRELVHARLEALPANMRTVLLLRDIEELDTQEVAVLLKTSKGAVKTRLHRARTALRRHLEPQWRGTVEDLIADLGICPSCRGKPQPGGVCPHCGRGGDPG